MRRYVINALAILGGWVVFTLLEKLVLQRTLGSALAIVQDSTNTPLAGVPVFLDRGNGAIERYLTDSTGVVPFSLEPAEYQRALWLICARGTIPMVGSRGPDLIGPAWYGVGAMRDSTFGFYRAKGWRGPIPRECPRGTDSVGWRYPPSAGKGPYAFTTTEPEWTH